MLRITVHDKPGALTFQLEGRLAGPWVRVLEECWKNALAGQLQAILDTACPSCGLTRCWPHALARQREATLRVDLTGATAIDAAGRACLAALHGRGAEFIAADCLTRAVVAEITRSPSGGAQEEGCSDD